MAPPLHHFYHIYADGEWVEPVSEHLLALRKNDLEKSLASINIGFVGSEERINSAKEFLDDDGVKYSVVAEEPTGWEQVTLTPLYHFIKDNDGFISYAHTKGAANTTEINKAWRKHMEYHNFVNWRTPVSALEEGKLLAGCYWLEVPTAKFFGGTFWWARIDALRDNEPPTYATRHDAEHWIGLLSKTHQLVPNQTLLDMSFNKPIALGYFDEKWE